MTMTMTMTRKLTTGLAAAFIAAVGLATPSLAGDYDKTITRNDGTVVHKTKTTDTNNSGRTVVTKTKSVAHTDGTGTTKTTTNTK
jgi:hypothetical protein